MLLKTFLLKKKKNRGRAVAASGDARISLGERKKSSDKSEKKECRNAA